MFAGHRAENMPASGASAKQADGARQLPTSSQPAAGHVYYDRTPHIGYRQHSENAVGGGIGILHRPRRAWDLLQGRLVRWSDANLESLRACQDLLTKDSRGAIAQFEQLRRAHVFDVPQRLLQAGIYRQTVKGNFAMGITALLRRL